MIDLQIVVILFAAALILAIWGFVKKQIFLLIAAGVFFLMIAGSFASGVSYVSGYNITYVNANFTSVIKNFTVFDDWYRYPLMISFSLLGMFFIFLSLFTKPKIDYSDGGDD